MDDFDNSANRIHKVGSRATHFPTNYGSKGKIMLVSVLVLFVALAIIALFHMYTRWLLVGRRSRLIILQNRRRRRARDLNLAFNDDTTANSISRGLGQRGLPPSILKSLPTFLYSAATREASPECAVCLSEFEEDETGRILPSCKHSFHVDCIDMWFRTHSNCPLCRAPVQNPDGTLLILVQLQPQTLEPSNSHNVVLPTVWSSFKDDRKLPELTSISVETLANGDREARGSSAPVSSSGSNGPPANI